MLRCTFEGYPSVDMMPLRYGIDALGPLRGYWGTDLTDPLGKDGYRRRSAHVAQQPDFLSQDDKNRVMGRRSVKVHAP